MNIYFLVEGQTELKVYPVWLSVLIPQLQQVKHHQQVRKNNYYIFSGFGYPSLLTQLANSIEDINDSGNFDYLVVCLDADDESIKSRRWEIWDFLKYNRIHLNKKVKLEIILQKHCFETWFLGCRKVFAQETGSLSAELDDYIQFYDVREQDPELMEKPRGYWQTTSIFHFSYFRAVLAERNIHYRKGRPQEVTEHYFLLDLIKRTFKTGHIHSFGYFLNFCRMIRKEIKEKEKQYTLKKQAVTQ